MKLNLIPAATHLAKYYRKHPALQVGKPEPSDGENVTFSSIFHTTKHQDIPDKKTDCSHPQS